jgi:hypothetical protein
MTFITHGFRVSVVSDVRLTFFILLENPVKLLFREKIYIRSNNYLTEIPGCPEKRIKKTLIPISLLNSNENQWGVVVFKF